MDALCSGCLFLLPEKTSDLVWEQYTPIKGETFAKVIQFLRDLGIVCKCEEGGWNDLSEQMLQTLREPFRSLIPFQFQPDQRSRLRCPSNSPLASAPGDDGVHRREESSLNRDRVRETREVGGDNAPPGRTFDLSGGSSKLTANGVIKNKRKQGSMRRRLPSFAKDLTAHQTPRPEDSFPFSRQTLHASRARRSEARHDTHARDLQCQVTQVPTGCWDSTQKDPGQWKLMPKHQQQKTGE